MKKVFRIVSFLEGISLLALLLIAMPAKYQFGIPQLIFPFGMTHGVLWTVYIFVSLAASHRLNWSVVTWIISLVVSVLPFGFLWFDYKLNQDDSVSSREQESQATS